MTQAQLAARSLHRAVTDRRIEQTDRDLLDAYIRERDADAFAELVRRFGPMVLATCRRQLGSLHDAEDTFQATFLALARQVDTIRQGEALAGWLHGVAFRIASKLKRETGRRRLREANTSARPQHDPINELTWREVLLALDEEVAALPTLYRGAFVLCVYDEVSHAEAAKRLGVKDGTISSRLAKAKRLLRQALQRRGISLPAALGLLGSTGGVKASVPGLLVMQAIRSADGHGARLSPKVVTLAEGVRSTMITITMKWTMAIVLVLGLFTMGMMGLADTPPQPVTSPEEPASPVVEEQLTSFSGKVVDENGKPIAGAKVYIWAEWSAGPETVTDAEGGFRLQVAPDRLTENAHLVARAEGCGPDWQALKKGENQDAITLHLPADDLPINGRILDLEGNPIAGAKVRVINIQKPAEGDLTPWLEKQKRGSTIGLPRLPIAAPQGNASLTDEEGRIHLTGVGRERIARISVTGAGLETTDFWVVTRPELPEGLRGGNLGTYPATFAHLVGPGKVIIGTVREKGTGKPLAGITVAYLLYGKIYTETDAEGNYRIEGVGKQTEYGVAVGGGPYFNATRHDIADTPGLEPIRVDFELEKGIPIRGRLSDRVTGLPLQGHVNYVPDPENPYLNDYPAVLEGGFLITDTGKVAEDGTFGTLAIPGPGAICVRAAPPDRYLQSLKPEVNLGNVIPEQYHVLLPINVSPDDPNTWEYDIELTPGHMVTGTVVDPQGEEISGVEVIGQWPVLQGFWEAEPLPSAEFRIGGLAESPRPVFFYHAERKLAKLVMLSAGTASPHRVTLEPMGSTRGQVLDDQGRPDVGVRVSVEIAREELSEKTVPLEVRIGYFVGEEKLRTSALTDVDGRFRLDGLVPGLPYRVQVGEANRVFKVETGKVKELGVIQP